jgi:MoaA/NifB/PqqE/SkfB family radical SAM enzyme
MRCQHCYSTSGPDRKDGLDVGTLARGLELLAAEGYNGLAVSGGDPLVYAELYELLRAGRSLGWTTTFTTNALLLDAKRIDQLAPVTSLFAISIDGAQQRHDSLRAMRGAFRRMAGRLALLRERGLPFALLFTLTGENKGDLAEVLRVAVESGARQLKVNPLEKTGRARDYAITPPTEQELADAFVALAVLKRELGSSIQIQFDALDRLLARKDPAVVFAAPGGADPVRDGEPLAALIAPLVVQEDGIVVPLTYGFGRRFALGQLGPDFAGQLRAWRHTGHPQFLRLARTVWESLADFDEERPFVDWYGRMAAQSHRGAP